MNEDNNENEADIRLTAIALGEFPEGAAESGEADRGKADAVTRVARLVEKAYDAEPDYRLTAVQRDLVLGGAHALRALPPVNAQNRRALMAAAGIGVAAAASVFLLLALWPTGPDSAGTNSIHAAAADVEEEGIVMRVQFLQKPAATLAANAAEPDVEVERSPDSQMVEVASAEPTVVGGETVPFPESENVSLAGLLGRIATMKKGELLEFDFSAAMASLDDAPFGEVDASRWRLAEFHSMAGNEKSAPTLQRLRFHGPQEGVSGMLVALRFDPDLVGRYRPAETAQWTQASRELVLEIPESAAKRGMWDLLLEVDPNQGSRMNSGRLGSAFSPNLGDVVVAGAGDQVVARLKVSSEMEMSPSLRRQLAVAKFSRWLASRNSGPAEILAEMQSLAGSEFEKVEAEIMRQLR